MRFLRIAETFEILHHWIWPSDISSRIAHGNGVGSIDSRFSRLANDPEDQSTAIIDAPAKECVACFVLVGALGAEGVVYAKILAREAFERSVAKCLLGLGPILLAKHDPLDTALSRRATRT